MLNDGSGHRPRLYPTKIPGKFERLHRISGTLFLLGFLIIPWIPWRNHGLLEIDLPGRRFYFGSITLTALDTPVVWMSLLVGALSLGLVTSLWGRIWCGYSCPQTVLLHEIVHRVEEFIEGNRGARRKLDDAPWTGRKIGLKAAKWLAFAFFAILFAGTGISYFERSTLVWTGQASATLYTIGAAIAGALFADFAWFREQFCNYLCPYARIQSVLQDPHTLSVGYDIKRGEPRRGTLKSGGLGGPIDLSGNRPRIQGNGECVDCGLCVAVCPQGIDIRHGFQLECITCARCVDACTSVMAKRNLPSLISYTTEAQIKGLPPARGHRVRPFIYAGLITVFASTLVFLVAHHNKLDATVTRPPGALFATLPDGSTQNQYRAHVVNYDDAPRTFDITVKGLPDAQVIAPSASIPVAPGKEADIPVFVVLPATDAKTRTIPFEFIIKSGDHEIARPATFKTGTEVH